MTGMSLHQFLIGSLITVIVGTAGATVHGDGAATPAIAPAPSPSSSQKGEAFPTVVDKGLTWPLSPRPTVVRTFVVGPHPWSPGHRGVDLRASLNQMVLAAASGTVVFAGTVAGRETVSVQHGNGIRTTYEPVHPQVRAGDWVHAGQPLGSVSPGHRPDMICLHWGARIGSRYLDPLLLLGSSYGGRPVLLPWGNQEEGRT
jgi:murein DD-endopeptidase MepM/ murein hydrolase activator NlpD